MQSIVETCTRHAAELKILVGAAIDIVVPKQTDFASDLTLSGRISVDLLPTSNGLSGGPYFQMSFSLVRTRKPQKRAKGATLQHVPPVPLTISCVYGEAILEILLSIPGACLSMCWSNAGRGGAMWALDEVWSERKSYGKLLGVIFAETWNTDRATIYEIEQSDSSYVARIAWSDTHFPSAPMGLIRAQGQAKVKELFDAIRDTSGPNTDAPKKRKGEKTPV
jgi:hypothetical protein